MPDQDSPPGERQPRRRRWRRWLVRTCLVALALPVLAYAFRDAWVGPLAVRWLREHARTELGAELEIGRVSSRGLESWTLEGVRWRSPRGPLLAVAEARVEVGFSLRGALRDAPELTVRVEGRGFELELESTEGSENQRLPDLKRVELDLSGSVLRRPGHEALRLDHLQAAGELRAMQARLEHLELGIDPLGAAPGENRLVLRDTVLDLAASDWLALVRGTRGRLEATLSDPRILAELSETSLPLRKLELSLDMEAGEASLKGHAELEGGTLVVEQGKLSLPPDAGLQELELALGMHAELDDLSVLEALVGRPLAGRWRGSIDVKGPLRAPVGRFVGEGDGLLVAGLALGEFDIDLKTDGHRARLERCEISGPELVAVLRGDLELHPLELVGLTLNVSADRGALAALLPVPCEHAFLHAHLDGPPTAPHGAFEVSCSGLELESLRIDDAAAHGRIETDAIEVDEARVTSGESFIELAGSLRRDGSDQRADLSRLTLEWHGARVDLQRGGRIDFGPGHVSAEDLEFSSESDGQSGSARISLQQAAGSTRATLDFLDYDAGPLLAPFLPADFAAGKANGHVEGTLGADQAGGIPSLSIDLALSDWHVGPTWPGLDATLRGRYDGSALDLQHFELGFPGDEVVQVSGALRVPIDLAHPLELAVGPLALDLEIATQDAVQSLQRAGIEPGLSSTGPCRLSLDLSGERDALRGGLTMEAQRVTMGTEAKARACDFAAELAFGDRIEVTRAEFSAPSGTITLDGAIETPLDIERWNQDRLALLEAPLSLSAKVDLADIGWIAGLSAELRRISGQVAGRVEIGGNALQPSLSGGLEWDEGELRTTSGDAPIRALKARLTFDHDVLVVEELSGEIGGAPVRVTGTVEPFGPYPRLDLALKGESVLLARSARLHLRADAELRVKGTPSQLAIRGELSVAEGRYLGEISPLEELLRVGKRSQPVPQTRFSLWPEGLLADATLDIHLGGTRSFEYQTNLLEAALRPDAWLRGTGSFPTIEGPVYVEEAKLTLPSGNLKLTSGLLTFRAGTSPLKPEVTLKAQIRLQRHDLQVVMTGSIDELEIALSSNPTMAEDDLWILFLTGQLPTSRTQDRSSQAMEALAVFLARDSLVRWFGSDPDETESLLERFEIDVGAKTSQSGQPTGRVLFYLRPQTRRSGRATYISAELDEYDRANYAFGIVFRPR